MTRLTTACAICSHAREHGSWPPDHRGTHCFGCGRSWSSLKESHCRICHQHFSADSVADSHEPYCTSDPAATRQSMEAAVTKGGDPVFDVRERAQGEVWIRWRPTAWEGVA